MDTRPSLILNELLTNVFKYAFDGVAPGHVSVELEQTDRQVTRTVRDDVTTSIVAFDV